jgi:hypothetical protein
MAANNRLAQIENPLGSGPKDTNGLISTARLS